MTDETERLPCGHALSELGYICGACSDDRNEKLRALAAENERLRIKAAADDAGREYDAATMREYEERIAHLRRAFEEIEQMDVDFKLGAAENFARVQEYALVEFRKDDDRIIKMDHFPFDDAMSELKAENEQLKERIAELEAMEEYELLEWRDSGYAELDMEPGDRVFVKRATTTRPQGVDDG